MLREQEMNKTIEEAARRYALDKVKGMHENNDCYHSIYFNSDKAFIAGDAHGYARAIEETSEELAKLKAENEKLVNDLALLGRNTRSNYVTSAEAVEVKRIRFEILKKISDNEKELI
jgi:hypothetical protein